LGKTTRSGRRLRRAKPLPGRGTAASKTRDNSKNHLDAAGNRATNHPQDVQAVTCSPSQWSRNGPGWNMITRNTTTYTVNDRNQVTADGSWSYS
jgi:hypothetical protein